MCPSKKLSVDKSYSALFGDALLTTADLNDDVWISDTGATQHMTKSEEHFITYTAFDEPKVITLGNKQTMTAKGKGDIMVETFANGAWTQHILKDVWYTPEVVKNLFSVPAAANKGFEYWLDKRYCKLMDSSETIVEGKRHNMVFTNS